MRVFIVMVVMILSLHSEMNFVSKPVEKSTQEERQIEGKILHLSRDRIIIKRRKYKGRHQYRRYNATKKKKVDKRWRNYKKKKVVRSRK